MADDWKEYPECPHCGAIQEYANATEGLCYWRWTCYSCQKRFALDVQVTRRYRATKIEQD